MNAACELRNPIGYLILSDAYNIEKFGLKKDRKKQIQLLEVAITLGSDAAKYELSQLLDWPHEVSENEKIRSRELLEEAAVIDYPEMGVINAKWKLRG